MSVLAVQFHARFLYCSHVPIFEVFLSGVAFTARLFHILMMNFTDSFLARSGDVFQAVHYYCGSKVCWGEGDGTGDMERGRIEREYEKESCDRKAKGREASRNDRNRTSIWSDSTAGLTAKVKKTQAQVTVPAFTVDTTFRHGKT